MNTKRILSVIYALSIIASAYADNQPIKVKSQIKEVKVFLKGAQLTNVATANIGSGTSELIFGNIAADIDENSIQVKGEGDFVILSVARKTDYLNNQPKPKEIKAIEDSLESVQNKYAIIQNLVNAFNSEEKMVLANQSIGGANNGVDPTDLKDAADFFRTRLADIADKRMEAQTKQKKLSDDISKLKNQLNELNYKRNRNNSDVIVTVSAKTSVTAKFLIEYVVHNASWIPYYEIRSTDSNSPLIVSAKANVTQNTGIDWNDVKLILSTGNPTLGGTKPSLNPWLLSFYDPGVYRSFKSSKSMTVPAASMMDGGTNSIAHEQNAAISASQTAADYTTVTETQTSNQFEIAIPYNIPSDADIHVVDIQSFNLNSTYNYYSAPKLDGDVFLVAKAMGWDQNVLLSGNANIFFEGTYVGKTNIDVQNTNDTLDLSLGRDKNIVVKRTRMKDFSERKFIGSTKKESFVYELVVRNKKKQEVEIIIEDQIPVSTNADIKVELTESSNASYNKETGKLSWKLKIISGEEKKLRFGYSVQYPKDKKILGL